MNQSLYLVFAFHHCRRVKYAPLLTLSAGKKTFRLLRRFRDDDLELRRSFFCVKTSASSIQIFLYRCCNTFLGTFYSGVCYKAITPVEYDSSSICYRIKYATRVLIYSKWATGLWLRKTSLLILDHLSSNKNIFVLKILSEFCMEIKWQNFLKCFEDFDHQFATV